MKATGALGWGSGNLTGFYGHAILKKMYAWENFMKRNIKAFLCGMLLAVICMASVAEAYPADISATILNLSVRGHASVTSESASAYTTYGASGAYITVNLKYYCTNESTGTIVLVSEKYTTGTNVAAVSASKTDSSYRSYRTVGYHTLSYGGQTWSGYTNAYYSGN